MGRRGEDMIEIRSEQREEQRREQLRLRGQQGAEETEGVRKLPAQRTGYGRVVESAPEVTASSRGARGGQARDGRERPEQHECKEGQQACEIKRNVAKEHSKR
jgi:hypothetical protein